MEKFYSHLAVSSGSSVWTSSSSSSVSGGAAGAAGSGGAAALSAPTAQSPAGTMLIELSPEDQEFLTVEEEMQNTIREHKDNGHAGGVFARYNVIKVRFWRRFQCPRLNYFSVGERYLLT